MSERTAYFEVADHDHYIFSNCKYEDLIVYTDVSSQAIHFGNTKDDNSAFMIRENDVNILRNISIGKSNPNYPLDVLGNTAIDGSVTTTKHIISRGLQVKKRFAPYFTDTRLPSGIVAGFSNDRDGLIISIGSNNSNNYIRFDASNKTVFNIEGTGNLIVYGDITPESSQANSIGSISNTFRDAFVDNLYIGANKVTSDGSNGHLQLPKVVLLDSVTLFSSNLKMGVQTSNPSCSFDINATDAISLPVGSTTERPTTVKQGQVRYNTTLATFEGLGIGNIWGSLGGVNDTNKDTYITAESYPTSNDDNITFVNSNQESMRVTKTCFVGIGTSNPSERLHVVNGNALFGTNVYTTNRLGVGTTSPQETLHVARGKMMISSNQVLACTNDYLENPSYSWWDNSNTGIYHPMTNQIGFVNGGTETIRITSNGIGIRKNNPSESLDVLGNLKVSSNIYVVSRLGVGTSNPSTLLEVNGDSKFNSNLEVLGNLTIRGTTTTVDSTTVNIADNILRVNNGMSYSSSLQAGIEINRGAGYSNYLFVFDESFNNFRIGQQGLLQTVATCDDSPNAYSIQLYDSVNKKFTGCNNLVYSNNFLGVGTSNPSFNMDIIGNIRVTGNILQGASGVPLLNVWSSNSVNDFFTMCNIAVKTSNAEGYALYVNGPIYAKTYSNLILNTITSSSTSNAPSAAALSNTAFLASSASNRAFISLVASCNLSDLPNKSMARSALSLNDTDSNVSFRTLGINTTTPSTTLEVNGGARVNSNLEIMGNLNVRGTTTTVDSTTVNITDNIIRLNNGASFTSALQAGIEVNRGTGCNNYMFVFDESLNYFMVGQTGQLQTVATRDDAPSSHTLSVYDNNNKKYTGCNLLVYSNNRLGVGTNQPSATLHIRGPTSSRAGVITDGVAELSISPGLRYNSLSTGWTTLDPNGSSSDTGVAFWDTVAIRNGLIIGSDSTYGLGTPPLYGLGIEGSVGIGTSNPTQRLHVQNGSILVNTNQVGQRATVQWQYSNFNPFTIQQDSNGIAIFENSSSISLSTSSNYYFYSKNQGSNVERMVINTSLGNVGIGTANTTHRLTLGGETAQFPSSLMINETSHVTSKRASMLVGNWAFLQDINGDGSRNFSIYQGNSGGATPMNVLNIVPSGNVGISTTTPQESLHVIGNTRIDGKYGAYAVLGLGMNTFATGSSDIIWLQPTAQNSFNITIEANGTTMTLAQAGMYSLNLKLNSDHSNTGSIAVSLFLNNVSIQSAEYSPPGGSSWNNGLEFVGQFMFYANALQQVKLVLYNNTGATTSWAWSDVMWSRCMIYRIG